MISINIVRKYIKLGKYTWNQEDTKCSSLIFILSLIICLHLLFGSYSTAFAAPIDTTSSWNGTSYVGYIGENFNAIGQTFIVAGDETRLDSFSIYINDRWYGIPGQVSSGPVEFSAYLMAWDGTSQRATGSSLWQSSLQATTNNGYSYPDDGIVDGGMEPFTFSSIGVDLVRDGKYVFFIHTTDGLLVSDTSDPLYPGESEYDGGTVGLTNQFNPYPDGNYVVSRLAGGPVNAATVTQWYNTGLSYPLSDADLAFVANFSGQPAQVPEPSTMLLLGSGLTGLVLWRKMRK